tara:strand:+ start:2612 stop:3130 length:519 start_codon:yes stop_codon:yes gene_type:complete
MATKELKDNNNDDSLLNLGLLSWLGEIERDNTGWSGYEHAAELADKAGSSGVSLRDLPKWWPNSRPFVIGNNIFTPQIWTDDTFKTIKNPTPEGDVEVIYGGPEVFSPYVIEDEIPHVAQWRDEGILGFLAKQVSDIWEHGKDSYKSLGTHESFHHMDPKEKERLTKRVLGE